MKPMFQWGQNGEVPGENQRAGGTDRWRVRNPLADRAPSGVGGEVAGEDTDGYINYPFVYGPEATRLVIVARREATAEIERGGSESSEAASIRAEEAAIAALDAWIEDDPYTVQTPYATSGGGYDRTEGGVDIYRGFAEETKFQVRIAPPFSGRATVKYAIVDDGTPTESTVTFDGIAGTSYLGIPRCIPIPLTDPLTDEHWLYLLEAPQTLSAILGVSRIAEITFANDYRAPAAPP
jgi:hypothetical protein